METATSFGNNMIDAQVLTDIAFLSQKKQNRDFKYRRNFNRYVNNGRRTEDVYNPYGNPLAYFYVMTDDDTGIIPQFNVIRSAIETITSKMAQLKVMPFFDPVNGTWKTQKVCRQAQVFFNEFFDEQEIYAKAIMSLRYALAIEYGGLWIDDETLSVKLIRPWQYFEDAAEYQYGKITRCLLEFQYYPITYLEEKIKGTKFERYLEDRSQLNCWYKVYYDLKNKMKYELIGQDIIKKTPIEYDCPPVITFYANEPLKGGYSVSLEDTSYTIQQKIDQTVQKISDALEVSPFNLIFIPENADKSNSPVKESKLTTQAGIVIRYDNSLTGGGDPVRIGTPAPISPEYREYVDWMEQKIYNLEGVSQLSAQSKKPVGLNSGKAIETLEDVESERFQDLEERYKKFCMKIATSVINIFPRDADVLPKKMGRAKIKWSDIKEEKDTFSVQFSDASALSKDPATKLGQVQNLISMQIISPDMAANLLQFPDLEKAYSVASASYDDCQHIIEKAAEKGDFNFYEVVNLQQLFSETAKTLLRLDANDENEKVLNNLKQLIEIITEKIGDVQQNVQANLPPLQVNGGQPPQVPGPSGQGNLPLTAPQQSPQMPQQGGQ